MLAWQNWQNRTGIYLAAPIVEMAIDSPYANKLLIFDPQGQVVLEHYKYGGPGMEGDRINGDRILDTVQTPYGVISGIICWDTVLQGTVLQAGRNGTDILFTPSLTYPETDPMFAQNSVIRGIENGVSTIHVSDMGLSVITDPYGRILASMDHYPKGERALVAQVPTRGAWTLYPLIGDLSGLAGWAGAVIFIPTLALALGVFSSDSRVFEVVYLLWWFVGPFSKTAGDGFHERRAAAFNPPTNTRSTIG